MQKEREFTGLRAHFWPIKMADMKKFIPLFIIFTCLLTASSLINDFKIIVIGNHFTPIDIIVRYTLCLAMMVILYSSTNMFDFLMKHFLKASIEASQEVNGLSRTVYNSAIGNVSIIIGITKIAFLLCVGIAMLYQKLGKELGNFISSSLMMSQNTSNFPDIATSILGTIFIFGIIMFGVVNMVSKRIQVAEHA